MKEESIELVKRAFRRYYFYKYEASIKEIKRREFGYAKFDNSMMRHLSFKDIDELRAFLIREIPADAYLSNAYYRNPVAEMDLKVWLSADLIFDIDIKDMHLSCIDNHTIPICPNCKRIEPSKTCNICNISIRYVNISCSNCIDAGKEQVKRVLDIMNDLGSFDVEVYFSGNNGFHLHMQDEELSLLDSEGRREIVDYVRGEGLIPEVFGINRKKNNVETIRKVIKATKGWKGRIIRELLTKKDEDQLFRSLIRKKYESFQKELEAITKRLSAYSVDPVVTTDIHRIFRLQGSLSSKSGLAKIKIGDIDNFKPYNDASLLDDEVVKVHVYNAPRFSLNNNNFGPYKDIDVSIPLYAAVYLICKGLADVT